MAIKASATITLSFMIDIKATYRYYKLQSSTSTTPSIPTTRPPSGWTDTEPSYTSGSTNTLYFVDCTVFADDSFSYTPVSKSSSYEAAKEAYNKAVAANNSATDANNKIDNLEIGGRNLALNSNKGWTSTAYNVVGNPAAQLSQEFIVGETYTITIKGTVNEGNRFGLWPHDSSGNLAYLTKNANVDDLHSVTFTVPSSFASKTDKAAYTIYNYPSATASSATIEWIKIEKGDKSTDWTPAPEDVQNNINNAQSSADNAQSSADEAKNTLDSMRSEMQYLKDAINALVGKDGSYSLLRVDENGTWSMNTTDLESISSLTELVVANRDNLSQAASDIETLVSSVDDLDTKTTYVYSGKTTYEDGTVEPWVELGRFDNGFKLTITNTRIVFFDGTETTTYFSNKALSTETLIQGDFQWQNRSNGNLGLKWIGVDI